MNYGNITCARFPCGMITGGSCSFTNCLNNPIYAATLNPPRPMGCICPPTSEQTCEAIACPRRDPFKRLHGPVGTPPTGKP